MVDERLVEYFKKWTSKGYSEEQIKSFLLKKGYPTNIIDEAAKTAVKTSVNPPVNTSNTVSDKKGPSPQPIHLSSSSLILPPKSPYEKKMWIITIIIMIFGVGILTTYLLNNENIDLSTDFWGTKNASGRSAGLTDSDASNPDGTVNIIPKINSTSGSASGSSSGSTSNVGSGSNNTGDYLSNNTYNISNNASDNINKTNTTINWSSIHSSGGGGGGGSSSDDDEDDPPAPSATCIDGILNQDEIGIDCGGVCSACICSGSNNRSCDISNGTGILYRTCNNGTWSDYDDECSVLSCNSGYRISNNSCILNTTGFVVNHTSTDVTQIPSCWIEKAKNDLRITYSHTSHGGQPIDGMWALKNFSSLYDYKSLWNWADSSWNNSTLYFREYEGYGPNVFPGLANASRKINASDLSRNLDWWDNLTRRYLDGETGGGVGENTTTIVWTWGGTYNENNGTYNEDNYTIPYYLTPEIVQTEYLDKVEALMEEYNGTNKRKVNFVLMTVHVDQWTNRSNEHNAVIREWCTNNSDKCILYDFADMEEYDPLGQNYVNQEISQSLRFDCISDNTWSCNWATDYLGTSVSNITYDYNLTAILKQRLFEDRFDYAGVVCDHSPGWNATAGQPSTGESNDSVLNCVLKGQAIWHLWARLAGWNGDETDIDCDGACNCIGPTNQSCNISNGTGIQYRTCNSCSWTDYDTCTVVSCDSGYEINNNSCTLSSNISGLVINHTSTNISMIPSCWIDRAKNLTFQYAHRSDGNNIFEGMGYLQTQNSTYKYNYAIDSLPAQTNPIGIRMMDGNPPLDDYSTPDLYWNTEAGRNATYSNWNTLSFDYSMWSWCDEMTYYSLSNTQSYLDVMSEMQENNSNSTFIYMTGYTENGDSDTVINNELIRNYTINNEKILYDFEDIGKYDPAGNYYADADRGCTWCTDWCTDHPSECVDLPTCSHAHGFICVQRGKAFWWMMARLAGWNGNSSDTCS